MPRPGTVLVRLVVLLSLGVFLRLLWSIVATRTAELDARSAGWSAVRIAIRGSALPGDSSVMIDPASSARLALGDRFAVLPMGSTSTWRPWSGIRVESYDYKVCSNPGSYVAHVSRRDSRWVVRFTDGLPGDCGQPG